MPTTAQILEILQHIAPLQYAAPWDNVGLLVEGDLQAPDPRCLLTIDLTPRVLEEALTARAKLVVAYHPIIFKSLKRITNDSPLGRTLLQAIRQGVTVYSPHTALDACEGGINDWMLQAFGQVSDVRPIEAIPGAPTNVGYGRIATLRTPQPLDTVVQTVKQHFALPHLRLARAQTGADAVRSVAVCPGAGGSVFEHVTNVDLFVTGEMRHHDVLAKNAYGASVLLAEHSNSERGYLTLLAARLRAAWKTCDVAVAQADKDPLHVV